MEIYSRRDCEVPAQDDLSELDVFVTDVAQAWPDESVELVDGSEWALLKAGKTIIHRWRTLTDPADRMYLDSLAGAIVSYYTGDKPLYYDSVIELESAWELLIGCTNCT